MDHPPRRRWIDVKTISCRGVKSFIPFQKPALYAILSLVAAPSGSKNHRRHHEHDDDDDDDDDQQQQQQQQQRTPVDLDGGENPEWDHPMRLSFSSPRVDRLPPLVLRFDVAAHNIPLLGDKVLAAAQVPVAHLLNATAEESPGGALRHLSYELRAPDGKPNGVLAFSFRTTTLGGGGRTDHVDHGIHVGAPISACTPQYSPPPNVALYPPLDPPPYYPPPEIYPPPPPPPPLLFPDPEPLYPPPGTRFPFQAHDRELYPPPSVPAHVACYPPQDPGCCHPTPRGTYGCPTDGWDRRGF